MRHQHRRISVDERQATRKRSAKSVPELEEDEEKAAGERSAIELHKSVIDSLIDQDLDKKHELAVPRAPSGDPDRKQKLRSMFLELVKSYIGVPSDRGVDG